MELTPMLTVARGIVLTVIIIVALGVALRAIIAKTKTAKGKAAREEKAMIRLFAEKRGIDRTPDNLQRLRPEYEAFVRECRAAWQARFHFQPNATIEGTLAEQEPSTEDDASRGLGVEGSHSRR
jgi:hypothetical protein